MTSDFNTKALVQVDGGLVERAAPRARLGAPSTKDGAVGLEPRGGALVTEVGIASIGDDWEEADNREEDGNDLLERAHLGFLALLGSGRCWVMMM